MLLLNFAIFLFHEKKEKLTLKRLFYYCWFGFSLKFDNKCKKMFRINNFKFIKLLRFYWNLVKILNHAIYSILIVLRFGWFPSEIMEFHETSQSPWILHISCKLGRETHFLSSRFWHGIPRLCKNQAILQGCQYKN